MVTADATCRAALARAAATLASSLLTLAGFSSATLPAAAAGDRLLVSRDGVHFTPDSTLPLFDRMGRVVPGDQSTEQVWVKNDSTVDAVLRIDLVGPRTDSPALGAAFWLSTRQPGRPAFVPVTIETGVRNGECTVLADGIALRPRQQLRLRLTAGVDRRLSERRGMLGTVRFRLRGVLTEAAGATPVVPGSACQQPPASSPDPTAPGPDQLPQTGPGALLPVGLIGAVAIVAGTLVSVIGWRRRRPKGSIEVPLHD
ncbi:MAG: hypothetical protein QM695_08725 [Micropruina sp.]